MGSFFSLKEVLTLFFTIEHALAAVKPDYQKMADSLGSVSASSTQTQLGQLKRKIRENLEKGVYAGATGPSPEKRKRAGDSNGQSLDGPPPKRRRTSKNTDAKKVTEAGSGIKNNNKGPVEQEVVVKKELKEEAPELPEAMHKAFEEEVEA